jgi:hypothetical protein
MRTSRNQHLKRLNRVAHSSIVPEYPLKPIDAKGWRIRKGDLVRIVGMPDLSSMAKNSRREVEPVFRHIRGTCKRVRGFARYGFAEISFKIRAGRYAGWHSVEMEPGLLLVQRKRA